MLAPIGWYNKVFRAFYIGATTGVEIAKLVNQ
jgi:hypothetical protein